jgi:hypothetical protein
VSPLSVYIGDNRHACALGAGSASLLSCVRNMQRDMHAAGHARTDSLPSRLSLEQACKACHFVSDPSRAKKANKKTNGGRVHQFRGGVAGLGSPCASEASNIAACARGGICVSISLSARPSHGPQKLKLHEAVTQTVNDQSFGAFTQTGMTHYFL